MLQLIHAKAARKVRKSSARAAPARSQAETRNALRRGAASGSCLSAIRKLASASRELIAFPKLCLQKNALAASLILGVLWSIWHLPVTNYLGTATPHGASWFSFFVAFAAAMTAIHSSPDFLDLHQYKQRIAGPAHACKLHRLPCHFQSTKCDS